MINYPFVYPVGEGRTRRRSSSRWAPRSTRRSTRTSRASPPLGGINIGVSAFSKNKDLAFEAIECLIKPENQLEIAELGGLPPVREDLYDQPEIEKIYPGFADVIRDVDRRRRPAPVGVAGLPGPVAGDPARAAPDDEDRPDEPRAAYDKLRDNVEKADQARGPAVSTAAPPQVGAGAPSKPQARSALTERPRGRAQARAGCSARRPSIVMLLVTAYPIVYAIVLSLQKVDLRFPDEGGFVGLDNYVTVLTLAAVVGGRLQHDASSPSSRSSIELVLGMILALVMHRAIFGRGARPHRRC